MDRTTEFAHATVIFSGGPITPSRHIPLSQYSKYSQRISESISDGEKVVARLSTLVNHKGFLNDPTQEIADITTIFKRDMETINKDVTNLQSMIMNCNSIQLREHYTVVSNSLKTRMSQALKGFQDALQIRTNVLKEQSTRRSKFSHVGRGPMVQIDSPMFPIPQSRQNHGQVPKQESMGSSSSSTSGPSNMNMNMNNNGYDSNKTNDGYGASTFGNGGMKEHEIAQGAGLRHRGNPFSARLKPGQQLQQQYYPVSNAQSRLEEAHQVESSIIELSGMFTKMATMVAEQGEIIARIDDDMDIAQSNVDAGQTELLKYFQIVSGNRSLILKIFAVLIFFIFLFVTLY